MESRERKVSPSMERHTAPQAPAAAPGERYWGGGLWLTAPVARPSHSPLAHTTQCKRRGPGRRRPLPGSPFPHWTRAGPRLGARAGISATAALTTVGSQLCCSLLTWVCRLLRPPLFLQLSGSSWGSQKPCGCSEDLSAPSSGAGGWTGQTSCPGRDSWSPWAWLAPASSGPGCCSSDCTCERPGTAPAGRESSSPSAPGTCQHSYPQLLLCTRRCPTRARR